MKRWFIGMALLLAWSCGGKAVVDPLGDTTTSSTSATGSGGSSSSSSGTTSTTSSGTSTSSGNGGGPVLDCEQACTDLFYCGLEGEPNGGQLCPGFELEDLELFLYGSEAMACVPTCEQMPALTALINPEDCSMTVMTLKGASGDFECACDFGPGSPECG